MPTRLHFLTLAEQHRLRQARRSNWRLIFVVGFVGLCAFAAGRVTAAELHLVLHGLSWHDGTRTEQRTTLEPVGDQCTRLGRKGNCTRTLAPVTREVAVDWNHENLGLGLRAALTPTFGVQAGYYRNSYDRDSFYAVAEWTPLAAGVLRAGAFAGAASGYENASVGAGLLARLQGDRASATLRLVPKLADEQSGTTVTLELGWRL